ncbi:MAG: hypothetical protein EBY16_01185 [Gammaproteobacteria bacterium]|nr:hypothetical protein [Gammaproteobacteria bacterium]
MLLNLMPAQVLWSKIILPNTSKTFFLKHKLSEKKPLQQCMTKLYDLVLTFEPLERLISNAIEVTHCQAI